MRTTFHRSAEEHERYAPHAFDGVIGKTVPWNLRETEDGPALSTPGTATVIAVEVDEDGRGATWTVDFEEEQPGDGSAPAGRPDMSFTVPEVPERWW